MLMATRWNMEDIKQTMSIIIMIIMVKKKIITKIIVPKMTITCQC